MNDHSVAEYNRRKNVKPTADARGFCAICILCVLVKLSGVLVRVSPRTSQSRSSHRVTEKTSNQGTNRRDAKLLATKLRGVNWRKSRCELRSQKCSPDSSRNRYLSLSLFL